MVIMAIDWGKARTGVAICDKFEMLASPLKVIKEKDPKKLLEKIAETAKENKAELIVVGLPKNMDGTEGESAETTKKLAEDLKKITKIQTDTIDERGTTLTAHMYLNRTDTRGKKRKAVVDAVAATIILEDYLNKRKNEKQI